MSVLSVENRNAYYTGNEEVRRLLQIADRLWGLTGKVALEPAVGSGAFPLTASRLGYQLDWVTNELFPEQTNYQADTAEDFFSLQVGKVDIVLGNPPYTGLAQGDDGQRLPLWLAFINQSFKWADRVAFVLPVAALNYNFLCRLPDGVEVVAWTTAEHAPYVLGGVGGSETKEVRTTTVFFERTGFEGYEFHAEPPHGFEWVETGDPEATHGVSLSLRLGEARCLKGSWGRRLPYSDREHQAKVSDPAMEAVLAANVIHDFAKQFTVALPAIQKREFNHYLTVAARRL
jgi:hypothetical protein